MWRLTLPEPSLVDRPHSRGHALIVAGALALSVASVASGCVDFFGPSDTAPPEQSASLPPLAGSIAYIQGADVWLAAPDGSHATRLTKDGARDAYRYPVQAADGTILALRGSGRLVALGRDGAPTRAAVTLPGAGAGARDLAVAPSGSRIAFVTDAGVSVTGLDGVPLAGSDLAGMTSVTWLDESTLVVGDGTRIFSSALGGQPQPWIDKTQGCATQDECPPGEDPTALTSSPSVSSDGYVAAYDYRPAFGLSARIVARISSPPADPPSDTCALPDQRLFAHPLTFAPDHAGIAFDDTTMPSGVIETTPGDGISVMPLELGLADCGTSRAQLVIPGGEQPSWGAAPP